MQRLFLILLIIIFLHLYSNIDAQDSTQFKGQASAWINFNSGNKLPVYTGLRYIPQLNSGLPLKNDHKIDFEISANINGSAGFNPFDSLKATGQIKPYRAWVRYSTQQFELRAGLQKLNFGSASLLRPLMWFDQIDPRDPLKLTDGVWGLLGRYYFLNNANIWLWGLYGNTKPRGWESFGTNKHYPEAGGRIQIPVPTGEAAITYNYRIADTRNFIGLNQAYSEVSENKLGFDIKLDMIVGLWFEGSWTNKNKDLGIFKNQEILNLGTDYTFKVGNGLYFIFEQLLASYDETPFGFKNSTSFSLMSVSYPVSIFDNLSAIVYFDWNKKKAYNFINWQKQFDKITLYFMGFWNPVDYNIPDQGQGQNLFAGKGVQVMLVFNH
jgi:hypothetical protein